MLWKRLGGVFWSVMTVFTIEVLRDQIRERRRKKIQEEYRRERGEPLFPNRNRLDGGTF